jgi:uncharacterized protein (DUF1697 family)
MTSHVALLRAINLGNHNKIPMAELRELLGSLGFLHVSTHLQSGNVVCTSPMVPVDVAGVIHRAIADRYGHDVDVMVRSTAELAEVIAGFPYPGADPKQSGVAFLSEPCTAALDASSFAPDECRVAGSHVYLHCPSGFGTTKLTHAWIENRSGVRATTRNWNTILKLADLANALDGSG